VAKSLILGMGGGRPSDTKEGESEGTSMRVKKHSKGIVKSSDDEPR